jgi:hypothetical protein
MERAKLSTAITLSITCIVWLALSILIYFKSSAEPLLIFVLILVAMVWIIAAGVTWAYWIVDRLIQLDMDFRRAQSISPMTEAANTIMRLSREQLDFLKLNGYYAARGIMATDNGPISVLLTPRGNIPWESAVKELRASTLLGLRSIRETSDGSPEREWRRLFTLWCVDMGLAIPAEGPYAARWIDKNSRSIAAGRMGVALYEEATEGDDE